MSTVIVAEYIKKSQQTRGIVPYVGALIFETPTTLKTLHSRDSQPYD